MAQLSSAAAEVFKSIQIFSVDTQHIILFPEGGIEITSDSSNHLTDTSGYSYVHGAVNMEERSPRRFLQQTVPRSSKFHQ